MELPNLPALLAPTWRERARAEDALQSWMLRQPEGSSPWPEPVQEALRLLQPSPEVFLSAVVAFWTRVRMRQHAAEMHRVLRTQWDGDVPINGGFETAGRLFPMTPQEPPISRIWSRGHSVLEFLQRLGPTAGRIEPVLCECLGVADESVAFSAVIALGGAEAIGDPTYARLLDLADRYGESGFAARDRFNALARHTQGQRLIDMMQSLVPGMSGRKLSVRCRILAALGREHASAIKALMLDLLKLKWSASGRADLLWALGAHCQDRSLGVSSLIQIAAYGDRKSEKLRSAVARILAMHDHDATRDRLNALARDPHPWVRYAVCGGLLVRPEVRPDLLLTLLGNCLGNFEGSDGEPHDACVSLIVQFPAAAAPSIQRILHWWQELSDDDDIDSGLLTQAMKTFDALTPHADLRPMLPGLQQVFRRLTSPEPTLEFPSLQTPGALPMLREALEANMLAAGSEPAQAAAWADLHALALGQFASEQASIQAEIDGEHDQLEAEWRDLHPEEFAEEDASGHAGDASEPDAPVDASEPDEHELLIAQVQAWIQRLS